MEGINGGFFKTKPECERMADAREDAGHSLTS
jgi:hypothetical protein